jgi:flagellar biosynthesis protein FliR
MTVVALLAPALRGAAAVAILLAVAGGGMPRLVQLGLAVVTGAWVAAVVGQPVDGDAAAWVAARELVLGGTLGIAAAVPLVAAATAGRLVDAAAPPGQAYRALFGVLAAAVFVGIDGHVTLVTAIADSYAAVPMLDAVQPGVLASLAALIALAVKLAIPWLVTAAVVQLAIGIGVRLGGRAVAGVPIAAATPAALVMMTAALVATAAIAIAAAMRGTLS